MWSDVAPNLGWPDTSPAMVPPQRLTPEMYLRAVTRLLTFLSMETEALLGAHLCDPGQDTGGGSASWAATPGEALGEGGGDT